MTSISRHGEHAWHGDLAALARRGLDLPDGGPVLIGVGGALRAAGTAGLPKERWPD